MTAQQDHTHAEAQDHGVDTHLAVEGKLSYIQIPALNVTTSGDFYARVFGWTVRTDYAPSHRSFEDPTRQIIGAFTTDNSAAQPGILPWIYVRKIDQTLARLRAEGSDIVRDVYPEGDLWLATFRDPAGNVIGIWQNGQR
ncbi:MAG: VOC family protein [Chloroflexi bacterium]|nr:VOC family protein [Chloroflexota bacterium]